MEAGLPPIPGSATFPGPSDYFNRLNRIFAAARSGSGDASHSGSRGGPLSFGYRVASRDLRLNFASPALVPWLTPAFQHLPAAAGDGVALTINIWDEASATEPMPPPPWSWESYMSRGEIGAYDRDAFRIWFDIATGVFSMIDLDSHQAVLWVKDPARLPIYVTAAPFRMILQAWFARQGLYYVHAAAVGNASGAALLAGAGGSGKSTTSLVCLAGGLDFLGDDYCLLASGSEARVHSLYCSGKLNPDMLRRLPGLQASAQCRASRKDDKLLLMLQDRFADRMVSDRPIKALLVPRVTERADTAIVPVSALAGIRALAPSTLQQIAGPDPAAWRAITALARHVPSFEIQVGYDLDQIPRRIGELLERAA